MSDSKSKIKIINEKKESRQIVKTILDFGVTEDQKIDVMINLAMSLESNENMKEIVNFLKKFTINFNTEENSAKIDSGDSKQNKILLD